MSALAHLSFPRIASGTKPQQDSVVDAALTILEFSRPQTTGAVTRGAARLLADMGYAPLLEVCLPNGRRADIMALGPKGDILICEVKSCLEDYRVDIKWGDYLPYCDRFYFAVAPEFPLSLIHISEPTRQ